MKENTPDELTQALEHLLHVASKHNATVAGFVVRIDEPMFFTRVTNLKDGFNETIKALCIAADTKIKQGAQVMNLVKPAS
jgi:hypothetical protein